jgi:O-antigen ligase
MVAVLLIFLATVVLPRDLYAIHLPVVPAVFCGIAVIWAVCQLIPGLGPPPIGTEFGPQTPGLNIQGTMAIDPERAIGGLTKFLTYLGVFVLTAIIGSRRAFCQRLMLAVVAIASAGTVYGMIFQVSGGLPLSGQFVNPNNYATYAGLATLIGLSRLYSIALPHSEGKGLVRNVLRTTLYRLAGEGSFLIVAISILVLGILLSGSRAGSVAFFLSLTLMMVVRYLIRSRGIVGIIAVFATIAIVGLTAFALAGDRLAIRLEAEGAVATDRLVLDDIAIQAISLRFWTGWGLDSFESLYSVLQPPTLSLVFDKAHNVYLETALDLGGPSALLVFISCVIVTARCLLGIARRRRAVEFPVAAFGCSVLVALHSFVEFSLQIPSVAIAYMAVLAMGWAQSFGTREGETNASSRNAEQG